MIDTLDAQRSEATAMRANRFVAKQANGFQGTDAQASNLLDVPARYWIVHFHVPMKP